MKDKNKKARVLEEIAVEIDKCSECKKKKIGRSVPGEGNPDAKIVFLGEAPGREEAKTGRPFIGRSGKLLRFLITGIGLAEEEVFITSPVKYLPVYGTPKRTDIAHGKTHLLKQLDVIEPKIIVLLGNVARQSLLEKPVFLTREHGRTIKENNRTYFITFHPAAALRFPPLKKLLIEDFQKLKNLIKKE